MIRALVILAALLAAGAGLQSWRLSRAQAGLDAAQAQLTAAEERIAAYAEAARIRARQDAELARLREEASAIDHTLSTTEGGDEELGSYLGAAARILWP
ncbi:hypothetical protein D2T29_00585 [Sinirhodobacter populi]|uniref:Uncharacterized protein n=1 Tax=Paenirhodobacter populi TaxID=2306993 RepID=A0A443KQB4_9RHOB|nr:hypothetical protein [Sinirhodobacter populi]RWR35008.1 hypothetical protein D2T29_00585 [Sinirhodobacter populi]